MKPQDLNLEARLSREPSFLEQNARRLKYLADSLLEPLAIGAITAYAAIEGTNIPLDKFLEGDPKSVLYAAGAGALAALATAIEVKKGSIRNLMSYRFKKNIGNSKFKDDKKGRLMPPNPGKSGWIKTPALASLIYMLIMPSSNVPYINKSIHHRYSIPKSFDKLKSNIGEIINMEPAVESALNGFDQNTVVHAQILRKTSTEKARRELDEALYRYKLYKELISEAYNNNQLDISGIDYWTFVGLLTHESNLNPNAISPVGAAGIGQQMPWVAKQLNRNVSIYLNYQENLRAYSHKLRYLLHINQNIQKIDQRFVPKESIHMAAEWLAFLTREHPNEDPNTTLLRYNTTPHAIDFAIRNASELLDKKMSQLTYFDIAPYLKDEGRMFTANVIAAAEIMKNPDKYNIKPIKLAK